MNTDPLIRARPIMKQLGDISRRALHDYVVRGDFPPPDVPAAKLGEPDRWLQSTAERGIREFVARRARPADAHEKLVGTTVPRKILPASARALKSPGAA